MKNLIVLAVMAATSISPPTPSLVDDLREISDSLRKVAHADKELSQEMNRKRVQPGLTWVDDDVIDPWNEMNPGLNPIDGNGVGIPAPPRKHWVDMAMGNMKDSLAVLDGQIKDLSTAFSAIKSGKKADEFRAQMDVLDDTYNNVTLGYQKLVPMTRGSEYDTKAIDTVVRGLHEDLASMNEERVRLLKIAKELNQ